MSNDVGREKPGKDGGDPHKKRERKDDTVNDAFGSEIKHIPIPFKLPVGLL
jgi:hypothetical protein